MEPNTTLNAVSLKRLSNPSTIALATWSWADCNPSNSTYCLALTLVYAEEEAGCNGALFGTAATGGDFNLQATVGSPAGFPRYQIQVDTTAADQNGFKPSSTFIFTMEGK